VVEFWERGSNETKKEKGGELSFTFERTDLRHFSETQSVGGLWGKKEAGIYLSMAEGVEEKGH